MKFGLHYLMSCADSQSPLQRYRDTLEQAIHSEALGFDSVWPVEHHFNRTVSILSCPTLMLATIAARTNTLRLGTAITQLPLAHPLRVAEEIATLDVLSGGRVEFGVGRGGNPAHFAGFGVPLSENRERLIEALEIIRQAWTEERFSFQGRFWQMEDLALVPRPLQQPHPPIRVAANSLETAEWAGRSDYAIIVASNINPFPKLRELLHAYRAARAEAGHAEARRDDVTLLMPLYVGRRRDTIKQDVAPSIKQYAHGAASLAGPALRKVTSEAERQKLQALLERLRGMTYEAVNDVTGIFDTPDACVERLREIEQEFNPSRVICWFNFGGMIPHDRVMSSMELFSAEVVPHFCSPIDSPFSS